MATWKLYWVTVPTPIENCFVVAKNSRSAAALEEAYDGFESGDCEADLVVPIPDRYFEIAKQKRLEWLQQNGSGKSGVADTSPWPDFAREWLLESIGATSTVQEGREIWLLDGRRFVTGSFEESYLNREPELIRSTVDLINRVTALPNGRWLYRGQRISTWKFECSLDREKYRKTRGNLPRADYERRMFEQFKLRALPYLKAIPRSEWEWLALAQHHGLPTRLLDWTTNPLIALYLPAEKGEGAHDAVVVAYHHNAPPVDSERISPFEITKIELYEPAHVQDRLVAQSSGFTAEPESKEKDKQEGRVVHEWQISASAIQVIRSELQKLGFVRTRLFPSLDSLCLELRDEGWNALP